MWVDIDNDGFLDLYVGNENEPNQLFLNNGNGTFKDISRSSGTDLSVLPKAVVAADYDNDGYADLFVSNYQGDSALLHNNHDGTFTDVARSGWCPGLRPWIRLLVFRLRQRRPAGSSGDQLRDVH